MSTQSTSTIRDVTGSQLRTMIETEPLPVIAVIYTNTSKESHQILPVLSELASKYDGEVIIAKLDAIAHQEAALCFHPVELPIVVSFKNRAIVGRLVGAKSESKLRHTIDQLLALK